MSDLELVRDIFLLMVGTWTASSRPTSFVGFYHPIPPPNLGLRHHKHH